MHPIDRDIFIIIILVILLFALGIASEVKNNHEKEMKELEIKKLTIENQKNIDISR